MIKTRIGIQFHLNLWLFKKRLFVLQFSSKYKVISFIMQVNKTDNSNFSRVISFSKKTRKTCSYTVLIDIFVELNGIF